MWCEEVTEKAFSEMAYARAVCKGCLLRRVRNEDPLLCCRRACIEGDDRQRTTPGSIELLAHFVACELLTLVLV